MTELTRQFGFCLALSRLLIKFAKLISNISLCSPNTLALTPSSQVEVCAGRALITVTSSSVLVS